MRHVNVPMVVEPVSSFQNYGRTCKTIYVEPKGELVGVIKNDDSRVTGIGILEFKRLGEHCWCIGGFVGRGVVGVNLSTQNDSKRVNKGNALVNDSICIELT